MDVLKLLKKCNRKISEYHDNNFAIPDIQLTQISELIKKYGYTLSIKRVINNFIKYKVMDNLVNRYEQSLLVHNSSRDYYILIYGDYGEDLYLQRRNIMNSAAGNAKRGKNDIFPSQIGYWTSKGYDIDSAKLKVSEFSRRGERFFIEKYGYDIGIIRYKDSIKKRIETRMSRPDYEELKERSITSRDNYIRKYGEEEGIKKWEIICKSRKGRNTLSDYISRYGEEQGTLKYNEYVKTITNNLSNFVRLYGEEEGIRKYIDRVSSMKGMFSFNWFVEKYGETAEILYREHWAKRLKKVAVASGASRKIFDPLLEWCRENSIKPYYGIEGNNEYFLYDKENNHIYFYDFTILDKKVIIEFHGEHCHPNPLKLTNEEWVNWRNAYNKSITAEDQHTFDLRKKEVAEMNGFTYIVIWSNDEILESIKKCKEYLI
jgi:hypothetical protein